MQNPLVNRRAWIGITTLLILFMVISYFSASQAPKQFPKYVSDSPSPTGVKALFTFLKNEKDMVKRWPQSPTLLPNGESNQTLVMIEPFFIPDSEEMNAYKDFIKAGNTIILFKENPIGMFDLKTTHGEIDSPIDEDPNVYNQEGNRFHAEVNSSVRLQTNKQDEILLYDEAGTIALKRSYDKGSLIVTNSPEWMTNGKLLNNDHLPLVLSLFNEENVSNLLFDEYTHGGQNAATIVTLYPKWFLFLLLQGILLTLLWLWYAGKRFGPIFIPREETVRFSDEGIKALAAWYLRGRRYQDSLVIQADYVKLLLQERWHIPYSKGWEDLSDHLERNLTQMHKFEILSFLNGLSNILEKEKISKQEYIIWSKKLDRLQKEVEAE
ncbi:DUF4350 domain-containing protein [Lederbergia citrea]|uniref:DUF4350 domain-containing protein n=1 Tax=Lederbergia citrea TaxID=2833581 RepID=UPI00201693E0|nr:DUF4350 domain-containing protein [Lederbergia citrea]